MVELIFLFYVLPKRMSRLARARRRSAVGWSLAAMAAWVGAEVVVAVLLGVAYGFGAVYRGWPEEPGAGFNILLYAASLLAAVGCAELVRLLLRSMPVAGDFTAPPPPSL